MKKFIWDVSTDQSGLFSRTGLRGREDRVIKTANLSYERNNLARTIFFMPAPPNARLLVKRYKIYNLWERLKSFVLSSKAVREYKALRYLKGKNIPVPKPVAVLERKSWGILSESFLFLTEVVGTTTLKQFLQQNYQGRITGKRCQEKLELLKKIALLIRSLHSINFYHQDLHAGNMLVQAQPGGDFKLYLIDLHRSRRINGLTSIRKQRNLAQICYSLNHILPVTDIVRFLTYYRSLDIRPETLRPFVRNVLNLVHRARHRHWQSRTKRCLKKSTRFTIDKYSNYRIYHPRSFSLEQAYKLIQQHNTLVQKEPARLFKSTPHRSISIHTLCPKGRVYIKEYRYRGLTLLKNLFRHHPARADWLATNGFKVRSMQVAQALALVEKKNWFTITHGYLILKEIKDAVPSSQYALITFASHGDPHNLLRAKKSYLKSFARTISHLHQRYIFHYDLKANNIMVRQDNIKHWSFYFLDLDRVRFKGELSWKERIKNLAQLNAATPAVLTRTDRLRFFNYYITGMSFSDPTERKNIIAEIMKLTIRRRHVWPPC